MILTKLLISKCKRERETFKKSQENKMLKLYRLIKLQCKILEYKRLPVVITTLESLSISFDYYQSQSYSRVSVHSFVCLSLLLNFIFTSKCNSIYTYQRHEFILMTIESCSAKILQCVQEKSVPCLLIYKRNRQTQITFFLETL